MSRTKLSHLLPCAHEVFSCWVFFFQIWTLIPCKTPILPSPFGDLEKLGRFPVATLIQFQHRSENMKPKFAVSDNLTWNTPVCPNWRPKIIGLFFRGLREASLEWVAKLFNFILDLFNSNFGAHSLRNSQFNDPFRASWKTLATFSLFRRKRPSSVFQACLKYASSVFQVCPKCAPSVLPERFKWTSGHHFRPSRFLLINRYFLHIFLVCNTAKLNTKGYVLLCFSLMFSGKVWWKAITYPDLQLICAVSW